MLRIAFPTLISLSLTIAACGGFSGESFDLDDDLPDDGLTDPGFGTPDDPCDGLDNNVDGTVDESCYCSPGDVQTCFGGDPRHAGVGACQQMGVQQCIRPQGDFSKGHWSACVGATLPAPELCGNQIDEDCDGFVAPCDIGDVTGLPCHPGQSERCYPGPAETEGFGICTAGMRFCGEHDLWGPCEDSVTPADEICDNGIDEDCDGSDASCG